MSWKKAALLLTLVGCTERPLENPNPPPEPPDADLWPLGGKIYHGTEGADAPEVNTDADATTPTEEDLATGDGALDDAGAESDETAPAEAPAEDAAEDTPEAPAEDAAEDTPAAPDAASSEPPSTEDSP